MPGTMQGTLLTAMQKNSGTREIISANALLEKRKKISREPFILITAVTTGCPKKAKKLLP